MLHYFARKLNTISAVKEGSGGDDKADNDGIGNKDKGKEDGSGARQLHADADARWPTPTQT